jgi:hypothetical protein
MNKMLEALKLLQDEAAPVEDTAVAAKRPMRRASSVVPTSAVSASKKFDVSSWAGTAPVEEAAAAEPAPAPIPTPPRFESPWERAARHDLSNPLQARGYQTVLLRWQEDLPGTHPRAVLIAGVGCEESDVAEFALRLGMDQARNGLSTLLVDAEPSRWLSNALVALDQPGLSEAYLEKIPPRHFLQPTFTDGLKLLPAGANLPELERNSVTMAKLVNDLKAQAQWTIISAANAGSDFAADLARASDAVYLLVRLGSATNLEATRVRQHLQGAGARLLGCIALDGTHV